MKDLARAAEDTGGGTTTVGTGQLDTCITHIFHHQAVVAHNCKVLWYACQAHYIHSVVQYANTPEAPFTVLQLSRCDGPVLKSSCTQNNLTLNNEVAIRT
jgi:hypothetical protein